MRILKAYDIPTSHVAIVLDYVMRQIYSGRENELGFQLQKQKSNPTITITDLDFTDDLALTQEIKQAQEVLSRLEAVGSQKKTRKI